ncbi:hypothetical protein C7212DRAFT_355588 [Tuber magnatum]|uniref:VHS domain-containing protein n=1 Tax=Tuber magnatum TaxID=42249 RepID=A0A317SZF9_9PEZI|nr:hypothetical protein C7212DRAFT_355588 [Tuber magnatum]
MKRILTTFKREKGDGLRDRDTGDGGISGSSASLAEDDTPEGRIVIATKSFCESGGPQNQNPGEEVLYLPTIVDLAESSPTAARAAAHTIRKFLELKKNNNNLRPHTQYNAIMLTRILSDNPGRTFTRNLAEAKFIGTVKELLKHGREPSVRQILIETLECFDGKAKVAGDGDEEVEGLKGLVGVWVKEKKSMAKLSKSAPAPGGGGFFTSSSDNTNDQYQPHHYPTHYPPTHEPQLPNMEELAARVSEAQTSAKLLEQVLQSTPHPEIPHNELIREFADRCKVASRSMQKYISASTGGDGGGMDEDTLTTLIMTNDLLTMAVGKHARAVKEALEKQEVHKTVEGARITDVAGGDADVMRGGGGGGSGTNEAMVL